MSELYHNRLLELAAEVPNAGHLVAPEGVSLKVSRLCGSRVGVEVILDASGQAIAEIGIDAAACALGQAAASVLGEHAVGTSIAEIIAARDALAAMLKAGGPPPAGKFWELRHLQAVADYPARQASTLLAFDAVVEAIEQALAARAA